MPKNVKTARLPTFSVWVLFCFFFSGMAGLIYLLLWLRMMDKVIGSTPFAVAAVLPVFMGGLAMGSWLAGKYIDRIISRRDLLSLFGKAELTIGIYGLLLPLFIYAVKPIYALAYNSLFMHFRLYQIFAFLGCSLLLLIPTVLMGITLPVLCRLYVEDLGHIGARTGRLYGINTIGAAVGTLLCGFVLIAELGVWGSIGTAAGINILVGVLCIGLAGKTGRLVSEPVAKSRDAGKPKTPAHPEAIPSDDKVKRSLALWIFGISGFCAMAYGVFWTRLLGLIIGPTTYSFSLIVSTYILGLGLGSILFGWLADKIKETFRLLVVTQICAANIALLVSQFLGNSQFFFSKLIYGFQGDFGEKVFLQSVILFFVLIGPALFLGAAFPLVNRIYARPLPHIGKSIGTAYAVNSIGAILGLLVAGFVFIPLLGKENGLRLTAGLQVFVSVPALVYLAVKAGERIRASVTGFITIALSLFFLGSFPSWNHNTLARGWYYRFDTIKQHFSTTSWFEAVWKGTSKIARQVADTEVVFYGDGIGGLTTVEKWVNPIGKANYYLLNSGKTDATSHADRLPQTLSAHVPLLFHPDPEKVMVLGLASGMTAGEALLYPVKQLDILEINDQVIKAAEFFMPFNNSCLTNPNTRMIVQNGKNHLELINETYDVIISEPSNPWMAGMANLFTLEYFKTAKGHLNGDGIFIQRTNADDMDWDTFSMIGRTFAKIFPDGLLIETDGASDFLLVGFSGKKNLDLKTADRNIAYAKQSKTVTIRDPRVIFNLIVTEDLKEFFGPGLLHTDNRPHLEFAAPKNIGRNSRTIQNNIKHNRRLSEETKALLELNKSIDASLDYLELLTAGSSPPFKEVELKIAAPSQQKRYQDILKEYCSNAYIIDYGMFPDTDLKKECARLQIEKIREHLADSPEDSKAYHRLAMGLRAMDDTGEGIDALRQAISLDPFFYEAYRELGEALSSQGKFDEAIARLSEALRINPDSAEIYNSLGSVFVDQGRIDEAVFNFTKAFQNNPDFSEAYYNLGAVYANQGDADEAIYYFSKAIDLEPAHAAAHNYLGIIYAALGQIEEASTHFLEAVKSAPDSAEYHNNAGLALKHQGQISASKNHFSEAIRINPKHSNAYYNLGRALMDEKRAEEAVGYLSKALEINPDDPEARKVLGMALGSLGRIEESATQFSEALRIDPDDPKTRELLGMALGSLGRIEESAAQFSEALRINPDSAETHDNLGVALLLMGRLEEAIDHFHKALDIDESFNIALDHLKIALREREKARE